MQILSQSVVFFAACIQSENEIPNEIDLMQKTLDQNAKKGRKKPYTPQF